MMRRVPLLVVIAAVLACGTGPQRDATPGADTTTYRAVVRLDSLPHNGQPGDARSLVTFADAATLEVPIRGAAVLFELPVAGRASWLMAAGVECSECDANTTIWVFRASPGSLRTLPLSFPHPGALTQAGTATAPYFRSRLYVGRCLDERRSAAVWFEEVLQPESARSRRLRVLEAVPRLTDRVLPWTPDADARVRAHVAAGRCREIPPEDQFVA